MSTRNLIWLVVIVAVGVAVAIATRVTWGIVGALAILVVSEVVERTLRNRRVAETGGTKPSLRSALKTRRTSR